MVGSVRYAPEAALDLDDIYGFVLEASANPVTAQRYVARIRTACDRLAIFPQRGTLRQDVGSGLRIIGFERRVAIAFAVSGEQVRVLRILYGGRELGTLRPAR